jgi:6-phosphogluconolactonase
LKAPDGEFRVVADVPAAFAELVAEEIGAALAESGRSPDDPFRLVLSGGPTARACYEALARRAGLDWARVECLVGDERCVPADHADANQLMLREVLIERVMPRPRFRPMDCDDPTEVYDAIVRARDALDLVHLGLGPDGHTASLFADSAALDAVGDRLVDHNLDPSGRNPYSRLTLTLAGIARGRVAVFTVEGASKREAMQKVLHRENVPATRVQADRVIWLCDRDAIGAERLP